MTLIQDSAALRDARLETKAEMDNAVTQFKLIMAKFDGPLSRMASHKNTDMHQKAKLQHIYNVYQALADNIDVLEKELKQFDTYDVDEQVIFLEVGQEILSKIYVFVQELPKQFPDLGD